MSADNWAICPRCRKRSPEADKWEFQTFREDYEFWGVEETEAVNVNYSGRCRVCGLAIDFEFSVPLPMEQS